MKGTDIAVFVVGIYLTMSIVTYVNYFDVDIPQENNVIEQFNKTAMTNAQNSNNPIFMGMRAIDIALTGGVFGSIIGYLSVFLSLIWNLGTFGGFIGDMLSMYVPAIITDIMIFGVMVISISFVVLYLLTNRQVQQ